MMMATMTSACMLAMLATIVFADTYMHNPRGSNNRLNERSANRNNGNRMFDSQNNNRGGYNKGDLATAAFANYDQQYDMSFYMSDRNHLSTGNGKSILSVEWTNQHGCGGNEHGDPHKLNCQVILQYMCMPEVPNSDNNIAQGVKDRMRTSCTHECHVPTANNRLCDPNVASPCPLIELEEEACKDANFVWRQADVNDEYNCPHRCTGVTGSVPGSKTLCEEAGGNWETGYVPRSLRMRDGLNTNRQQFTNPSNNEDESARFNRKVGDVDNTRGLHESWEWYDECYRRERNRGLFTADQNLRNNNLGYSSAVYTRQNPNNNRRGYECPEERDHYPYWHPSPWIDIAVMTDRLDMCDWYREESQNVKSKHLCRNTKDCPRCIRFNNERQCKQNQGKWVEVGAHNVPAPECIQAPWSRVNHLGNGRYGQANTYNWTLPYILGGYTSTWNAGDASEPVKIAVNQRCVLRVRYNISTDDYDAWMVNASFNNNNGQGIKSPVRQNPNVNIGTTATALRLAINTAQFGRTFQDRSHVFVLKPREQDTIRPKPTGTPASIYVDENNTPRTLWNLNVRGKRGNIVQTFPSVEYDFAPNQLHITDHDLVHFQWTGSNTHNNGNPAGDGQAGDAGEGRGGTDRHNVVELRRRHFGDSFPATWEENTMFQTMLDAWSPSPTFQTEDSTKSWTEVKRDWALRMASAGYYRNLADVQNTNKAKLDRLLNNAPASFAGGVFRFKKGSYNYMCTRNHNFSNRDQKGVLIVENKVTT